MAKTKDQLRLENDQNFPNNNTGFITAAGLRGFNDDMIESLATQADLDAIDDRVTANSESIELLSSSFENFSSSLDNDFVSEAEFAAYTSSANADSASVSTRVTDLENFSSSLSTDFVSETEFTAYTSSNDSTIEGLATTSSLNTYTSSNDSRVQSLETETGSLQSQIDALVLSGSGIVVENDGVSLGTATTLNFTGSSVTATYLGGTATIEVDATAIDTSSLATTGSNSFVGNQTITGDLFVDGDLTARTLYIDSSSILYTSGSNKFGDSLDDVQELTGSVSITGSFTAPLEDGNIWVGANGVNSQIPSSSLQGVQFPFSGSAQITGSLGVTGSINNVLGLAQKTIFEQDNANQLGNEPVVLIKTTGAQTNFKGELLELYSQRGDTASDARAFNVKNVNGDKFTVWNDGRTTINANTEITGSLRVTGSLEASLEDGYIWVGSSGVSTQIPSSSLVNAGTSGTSGINGLPGDNGTSGVDGDNGTSGIDGNDGTSGVNGADGTSGVNGADGTSGINGLPGDNGTSGVNGADGTSGVNGADGTSGVSPLLSPYTGSVNILGDVAIDGTLSSTAVAQLTASWAENALSSSVSIYSDNTIVTGKNVSGGTIEKGTPLFFTGSGTAGNLVGILPADAGNATLMPAGGVAGEQILDTEEGVVLLDGFINGVDTSGFTAGDEVFVGVGGGYTNVVPTGSANLIQKLGNIEKVDATNGSGVINGPGATRSLPNILEGYAWVGNSDDVPTAVATSSFVASDFPFEGKAEITGSLGVSGSISITTGSLEGVVVDNVGDTFTSVPSIDHIVTLTQTEYDGLTPDDNTLYVISGSTVSNDAFPYSGSAQITGSLGVTGSIENVLGVGQQTLFTINNDDQSANVPVVKITSTGTQAVDKGALLRLESGRGDGASLTPILNVRNDTSDKFTIFTDGRHRINGNTTLTGSLDVTGSLEVTGKVNGNVVTTTPASSTASFDLSAGTFFTSSINGTTHLEFSNISSGVTAQIEITTAGTPVVDFASNVLQSSGSEYIPSDAGGKDILTVVSMDGTSVLVVSANKFI